jgi:PAS domain S-box-containing protein
MIAGFHRETRAAAEHPESRSSAFGYVVAGVAAAAAAAVRLALDPQVGTSFLTFAAFGVVAGASAFAGFTARRSYVQVLAAARESEQRYAAVFESSPFALALMRLPKGTVVEANAALLRLYGYRRDDVVGRTTVGLGITPSPAYAAMTWELHRGGSVRDFECVRRTAGSVQTLAISMDQVTLSGERYAMLAVRDITDQRQLEEALRKSDQRLARAGLVEN